MFLKSRFVGTIFLVAGATIGAGMLALPTVTAFAGFIPSLILVLTCWLFLLLCAFLYLEVNLSLEGEVNLVSMARATMGKWGEKLCWIIVLLLLYAIETAYIAGIGPIFNDWLTYFTGVTLPKFLAPLPILLFFGSFVYIGTRAVDGLNRVMLLGLFVAYIALVIFLPSHLKGDLLKHTDFSPLLVALPIVVTAFGFHHMIPTLVNYLNKDRKKLMRAFFIGSLIPLIIDLVWVFLVLGSVPIKGDHGLAEAWTKGQPATYSLIFNVDTPAIATAASLFAFFAIIASFSGVSLGLTDFLFDGFKAKKTHRNRLLILLLVVVPPLLLSYISERGFLIALSFAGVFVAILFGIFPILMMLNLKKETFWNRGKGKIILYIALIFFLITIAANLLHKGGILNSLINKYLS